MEENLVVELDGSQHCEAENVIADQQRTAFFMQKGLCVLRFANTDIWKNFSGVCETIDLEVKRRISRGE